MIALPPSEFIGHVGYARMEWSGSHHSVVPGSHMWGTVSHDEMARVDHHAVMQWLDQYGNIPEIAVDTETTGLRIGPGQDRAVIWSLSDGHRRWTVPARVLPYFDRFLRDPNRTLWFHKANYDTHILRNSGIDLFSGVPRWISRRRCTMIGHALVADHLPHTLKFAGPDMICSQHDLPKFEMLPFNEVFGRNAKEEDTAKHLIEKLAYPEGFAAACDYASQDAWVTMRLAWEEKNVLQKRLLPPAFGWLMFNIGPDQRQFTEWDYFLELEMRMMDVCYHMELEGVTIDVPKLGAMAPEFNAELTRLGQEASGILGRVINLGNKNHLRKVLFGPDSIYKLDPIKMTSGGSSGNRQPAVDAAVLEVLQTHTGPDGELSPVARLAKLAEEYSVIDKLRGTYVDGLLELIAPDGRIHGNFNQQVTRTGRLSSSGPNLQNIPIRTRLGKRIREAFIAGPGYYMTCPDYSQIEPRTTAAFSEDRNLVDSILMGRDVHSMTAAEMFQIPYEWIDGAKRLDDDPVADNSEFPARFPGCPHTLDYLLDRRRIAKTVRLGLTYGMGPVKLAKDLGCTVREAKDHVNRYWAVSRGVRAYFDAQIAKAREEEVTSTLLGRIRDVSGINSQNWSSRGEAERIVQNTGIQGTAAEIVKMAAIRLYLDDVLWDAGVKQVIQVHDEILFTIPETSPSEVILPRIQMIMENPFHYPPLQMSDGRYIPLEARPKVGRTWIEAK